MRGLAHGHTPPVPAVSRNRQFSFHSQKRKTKNCMVPSLELSPCAFWLQDRKTNLRDLSHDQNCCMNTREAQNLRKGGRARECGFLTLRSSVLSAVQRLVPRCRPNRTAFGVRVHMSSPGASEVSQHSSAHLLPFQRPQEGA